MLSILRQGQKWLLWIIIIGVGGVFVFTFGIGGGGPAPGARNNTAVQVLDRSYTTRDFARLRDGQIEELREEYGEYIDEMAESGQFDKYAVDSLIRSGVLASEAERLGIVVSDIEVREFLRSLPGVVNDEGEIDEEAVTTFAEREYGTLRRLQERLRDELLTSKLSRLIRQSASVTRQEAVASMIYAQEEVDIAWVGFDPKDLADVLHFDDVEIADFVEKETDRIAAAYKERHSEFNRPEEVALRHILIAKTISLIPIKPKVERRFKRQRNAFFRVKVSSKSQKTFPWTEVRKTKADSWEPSDARGCCPNLQKSPLI